MEAQTLLPFKSKTRAAGDVGHVGPRGPGLLLQNCQHLNGSRRVPFRGEVWLMGTLCFLLIAGTTLVTQDWDAFELEEACCSAVNVTGRNSEWEPHSLEQPQAAEQVRFINWCLVTSWERL